MADPVRPSNTGLGQAVLLYDADGKPLKTIDNGDGTTSLIVQALGAGASITHIVDLVYSEILVNDYYIDNSVTIYEEILVLGIEDLVNLALYTGRTFDDSGWVELPFTAEAGGGKYGKLFKTYLCPHLWITGIGQYPEMIRVYGLKNSNQNLAISGSLGVLNSSSARIDPVERTDVLWFQSRQDFRALFEQTRFDEDNAVKYYAYTAPIGGGSGATFIKRVDTATGEIKFAGVSTGDLDNFWANRASYGYVDWQIIDIHI